MLTGTTILAIRALILLGLSGEDKPVPPRRLAETLGCSPTYLGKTLGRLVRGGILRSTRGAHGGVMIASAPNRIALLEIVESCQGPVLGNYCQGVSPEDFGTTCRFHRVMFELHEDVVRTLSKCTLAELLACPAPSSRGRTRSRPTCKLAIDGLAALRTARH